LIVVDLSTFYGIRNKIGDVAKKQKYATEASKSSLGLRGLALDLLDFDLLLCDLEDDVIVACKQ
jgi:hypothetical protein